RPRYSDGKVDPEAKRNQWKQIVGPDGSPGTVSVYQDASIFATKLDASQHLDYTVEGGRHAWLQVASGSLVVNGTTLHAGDAIATSRASQLHAIAEAETEALLFDLG
ncbi:MAG: quercetin 2,3-dioxygenase, partial [Planctomycetota bacterium]